MAGDTSRTLEPGEPLPTGKRWRFRDSAGYVILKWKVGRRAYIEHKEHRLVAGARPGEHVHHVNGDKADNRPENLVIMSPEAHARLHATPLRRLDQEDARRLYESGQTTTAIARLYGVNNATVYRVLVRMGVPLRRGRAMYSDESWAAARAKVAASVSSPEGKAVRSAKSRAMWASRSPEERAAVGRRISEARRQTRAYLAQHAPGAEQ